ncbi:MAG: alkaline phosphatase D family protein [Sporichthyaceae bacterium]
MEPPTQLPKYPFSRRQFLQTGSAAAMMPLVPGLSDLPSGPPGTAGRALDTVSSKLPARNPFTLGVASGEPTPDGIVLWTRLAPDPLAEDGSGGMVARETAVSWQLATDRRFRRVVRAGSVAALPDEAHSVHVELAGLEPGRDYWYRFKTGSHVSQTGRTRTAPAPESLAPIEFVTTSCANWEEGWFTAYKHIAASTPDLIFNLGDYLYEYREGFKPISKGDVRAHAGGRLQTLADYRRRHAQYKTDADLQAAHRAAPWVVVPDDHEVANNWTGEFAARKSDQKHWATMRAAAFRAYWEHMPLRRTSYPTSTGMQLFRALPWGRTANFYVLDTRQYRSQLACQPGDDNPDQLDCLAQADRADPGRTVLGARQEAWLSEQMGQSRAVWNLLAQQIMFAAKPRSVNADGAVLPHEAVTVDSWDGYPGARDRLLAAVEAVGLRNFVVLTGDVHSHWAADIHRDFGAAGLPPVGVELVTSSITTGGDGRPQPRWVRDQLRRHPYLRYWDGRRGWIRCRADASTFRADFHVVPKVSQPWSGGPIAASFEIADEAPGLRRV